MGETCSTHERDDKCKNKSEKLKEGGDLENIGVPDRWEENITPLLATCFLLVSCLDYASTLKMGHVPPEKSVDFHQITPCNDPRDTTLHNDRCEKLKILQRKVAWFYF
jgi:hypothetical protein